MVDIQFGMVLFEFGLESMLKNVARLSSEGMDNTTLPSSPMVPSHLIARDISFRRKYEKIDFVAHTLSVFEGVQYSKGPFYKKHLVLTLF